MKRTFLVSEDTLVFAFRYALGRRTGAVSSMVEELDKHWNYLAHDTQQQIRRDIKSAISRGDAGMDCDVSEWRKVLSWGRDEDECPVCHMVYYNCLCSHDDHNAHE